MKAVTLLAAAAAVSSPTIPTATPGFGFDSKDTPVKPFYADGRDSQRRRDDRKAARKRAMRLRARRGR